MTSLPENKAGKSAVTVASNANAFEIGAPIPTFIPQVGMPHAMVGDRGMIDHDALRHAGGA